MHPNCGDRAVSTTPVIVRLLFVPHDPITYENHLKFNLIRTQKRHRNPAFASPLLSAPPPLVWTGLSKASGEGTRHLERCCRFVRKKCRMRTCTGSRGAVFPFNSWILVRAISTGCSRRMTVIANGSLCLCIFFHRKKAFFSDTRGSSAAVPSVILSYLTPSYCS